MCERMPVRDAWTALVVTCVVYLELRPRHLDRQSESSRNLEAAQSDPVVASPRTLLSKLESLHIVGALSRSSISQRMSATVPKVPQRGQTGHSAPAPIAHAAVATLVPEWACSALLAACARWRAQGAWQALRADLCAHGRAARSRGALGGLAAGAQQKQQMS